MRISDWSSDVCSSDLTPVSQNGTVEPIAQPYLDGFQPLIASFGLGVMKLGLGQPREKAGLALATSLDVGLDLRALQPLQCVRQASVGSRRSIDRSEEHTSELQSLMRISYAVFCLKKKQHYLTLQTNAHPP